MYFVHLPTSTILVRCDIGEPGPSVSLCKNPNWSSVVSPWLMGLRSAAAGDFDLLMLLS